MLFSSEREPPAWWLMNNTDVDAAKLLLTVSRLPDWRSLLPRLFNGLIGLQVRGAWQTTVANVWGMLAVQRFSQQFETKPVTGSTRLSLDNKTVHSFDWKAHPTASTLQLAWPPSGTGKLHFAHQGQGAPWASIRSEAAVLLRAPQSAGFVLRKTLLPLDPTHKEKKRVGDIVKVRLEIEARSAMSWVVVDDPIPAGASILGSGLLRDSRVAQRTEQQDTQVYPSFIERSFGRYRAYYEYVPRGQFFVEYTLRLNTEGIFGLPASRVEAMYAPDVFAALPNPAFVITGRIASE